MTGAVVGDIFVDRTISVPNGVTITLYSEDKNRWVVMSLPPCGTALPPSSLLRPFHFPSILVRKTLQARCALKTAQSYVQMAAQRSAAVYASYTYMYPHCSNVRLRIFARGPPCATQPVNS